MGFWDKLKGFFSKRPVIVDVSADKVPVTEVTEAVQDTSIERPERPSTGVDRNVEVVNPAWSSVQDYMDRNLTDVGVRRYEDEQLQMAALFNVVADPDQSPAIKHDAYEELEERLAEYGFIFRGGINSMSDFDWGDFKNNYTEIAG